MTIEILHWRDPDSSCDIQVWIDGVEIRDLVVENVDPGAGWEREDWDESTRAVTESSELSEPFKAAVLEARALAGESKYIQ